MIHNKTNAELLVEFDKHVIGHEQAKKVLISLVNRSKTAHYYKYLAPMYGDKFEDVETVSAMLIGKSGTGKTFLINTLKKLVDFPLVCVDATTLEPAGGSNSADAQSVLDAIVHNAQELVETPDNAYFSLEATVDQTVVFIDEIDKLAKPFESTGNWNKMIQSGLLGILENNEQFSKVSFVLAGAFADLKKEHVKVTSMGFHKAETAVQEDLTITDKDIVKYGLMPELVGRLSNVVTLEELTAKTMKTILNTVLLPAKVKELSLMGITVPDRLDRETESRIIKISMDSEQGVRSLKRELTKIFNDLEFSYEERGEILLLPPGAKLVL